MYSEMSGAYPRMPSPATEPRDRLSSQLVFDCASLRAMGWPSCRTLWTVMSALNVCTSSARIGCLGALSASPRYWPAAPESRLGRHLHFHALPKRGRALVVPSVYDACSHVFPCTAISFVYMARFRGPDVRLGDTSSMLVALRMLMASSDSCLASFILAHRTGVPAIVLFRMSFMAVNVMLYVLAHVDIARTSVERHVGGRMRFLRLRVDGRKQSQTSKGVREDARKPAKKVRKEVGWFGHLVQSTIVGAT